MQTTKIHQLLTAPISKTSDPRTLFWLALSLALAVILNVPAWQEAFSSQYVVQDDARQHLFWMQRFLDPELFPGDLIADYFQSVAPTGYTAFYQMMAALGIDPWLLHKILPMVLSAIATCYCFGVTLEIFPVPLAGFISSLLLNQNLCLTDNLVSGTPRAFLYPIFLAFLYYLLRRQLLCCLIAIAFLGLFYPQLLLVSAGVLALQLIRFDNGKLSLSFDRADWIFSLSGLSVAVLTILLYAFKQASIFGPIITATEARKLPEFLLGGRVAFFVDNPFEFWLTKERSGIFPDADKMLQPILILTGLFLPAIFKRSHRFPLVDLVSSKIKILPQIALVSISLFLAAHAVLFKLHHPNRYTQHSLRVVLAISAGIALTIILNSILVLIQNPAKLRFRNRRIGAVLLIILLVFGSPNILILVGYRFPDPNYITGKESELYEFFAKQPKDSLIASLAWEANNIPSFSQRSILVSREYALPYHVGYYRQFRQRTLDLIRAQYSENIADIQNLIEKYQVNFWLLEAQAFTPEYLLENRWLRSYKPTVNEVAASLERGNKPALKSSIDRCRVFETQNHKLLVLQAECLKKMGNPKK
jgi:hypothetical protein